MGYISEGRMPIQYEGKEHFYYQNRLRKRRRKIESIQFEDLIDAYHKLDDKNEDQEPEYMVEEKLKQILNDIRNGDYGPSKVRKVKIPKSSGGTRELNIPSVLDRVVAKAVLARLTPVVDPKFDCRSHGGRPDRGIQSAIAEAYKAIEAGMHNVLAADIKDAFPNTPTEAAISILEKQSGQHPCMELAKVCIRGHKGAKRKIGVDQGNPLSPICFNAYMGEWVDSQVPRDADIRYVRYLDNLYLFGKDLMKLISLMADVNQVLTDKGFVLKTDPCLDLKTEKLSILGYQIGFDGSKIEITGDEDSFKELALSLEGAYEKPNSHKLGKPIVDSWISSQALRTSWDLKDTHKVNELLDYYGFQYKVNHEEVIKELQDQRISWVQKYNLNNNQ